MCAREWDWRNKIMRMSSLPRPPPNKKHMKLIINSRQFVTKRNVFPKLIKKHSLSSAPKLAGKLLFRQNNVGFDIYICKLLAMFTKCCEHLPQIRTQIGFDGHDAVLSFCNVFFFTLEAQFIWPSQGFTFSTWSRIWKFQTHFEKMCLHLEDLGQDHQT